jgi:transcriptional regulator with XRE-family HTH domain
MIDKKLCDQVKFIRKKMSSDPKTGKPLTQVAFAKSLGKSPSIIAEIETYKIEPSKAVIKKIIEVYGVNLFEEKTDTNFNLDDFVEKEFRPKAGTDPKIDQLLKSIDQSSQKLYETVFPLIKNSPELKNLESQFRAVSYQLQEQKAENDSLRKEIDRLKNENLRLFTELEKLKGLLEGKK